MKSPFVLLSICLYLVSCNPPKPSRSEVVTSYYSAFDEGDFNLLRTLIADSLTIGEGPYVTTYSHESFHEHFRWDSVFQPTYQITELVEEGDQVIVTVSSTSVRYEFLKNNPLVCQYKFSVKEERVRDIEVLGCPGANWEIWEQRRDPLVNWIAETHPELNGFIHDLSMQGAINYVQAMQLYQNTPDSVNSYR